MGYKKLNEKSKAFIASKAGKSNSFLKGKNRYKLPYSTDTGQTFQASITYNGKQILTDADFVPVLYDLIDKYSNLYELDANIIAAQTFRESGYRIWDYSQTGALGLSQFTPSTIFEIIVKNNKFSSSLLKFTDEEINKITNGIGKDSSSIRSTSNRLKLHNNIMNNPEIIIKAQCYLMNYIGSRNNNLAASALFAYNRGSALKSNSYPEIIRKCTLPLNEGINYVYEIFKILKNNMGYDIDLNNDDVANQGGTFIDPNSPNDGIILNSQQENYVKDLHVAVKPLFRKLIFEVQKQSKYTVLVTSGYRTFAQQQKQKDADERNATPGYSLHNYGLAIDFVLIKGNFNSKTGHYDAEIRKNSAYINGINYTDQDTVKQFWIDSGAPAIGKQLGFSWGGNFNNYFDPVHFDLKTQYDINVLLSNAKQQFGDNSNNIQGNQVRLT